MLMALPGLSYAHQAAGASGMSALRGNQPGWARAQADEGRVPGSLPLPRLRLFLRPSLAQQAALRELLRQQQDPTSPQYQHWLTPEEYGARFGVAPERLRALAVWLSAEGFTVTGMARGRNWIRFQGTAAQAEAAFHTELHYYRTAGRVHFANAAPPRVPAEFGGDVAAIEGLNDLLDTPGAIAAQTVSPQLDAGAGHVLAPADLATIYDFNPLWNQGITGSGVSIAVVGESDFNAADINAFRSTIGIGPTTVQTVVAAGSSDPGFNSAELEADLDLEWAGGVAPDAHLIYVEDVSALDAATYAIDQKLAPIVSESYGKCELVVASAAAAAFEAVVQQGNAEGITMVNGSGDSGPGDCDLKASSEISGGLAVHYPASVPEITAVGGTEFDEG
ncbi:MAG: S53 family peptidase, partial [Streptosporangiaceae bacterium]